MFRRILNRSFFTHAMLGAGATGFAVAYSSHAYFGDKIVKYCRSKGIDGIFVPLRATMKVKFDEIAADLKLTQWNKNFFHFYVCDGLEPIQLGSTNLSNGVHIGIPQYLQAADEDEITQCNILVDGKRVDWVSPEGDRLLQSLQLSENAKKFLLAKLVLQGNNYKFLFDSFLPSFSLSAYYGISHFAHSFFNLMQKPMASSILVHSVIGGFIILLYLFLNDGLGIVYDKSIEEQLYELKELYILGGIEYHEKMIERNKALRDLVKNGHRRYSVCGNEVNILRSKGLPETFKLKMAQEFLIKNYQKEYAAQIPTPRKPQPIM